MSDKRLTVAVIIPTYNRPAELERCLRSIASQTRRPDEVIVVDDGQLNATPFARIFADTPVGFVYIRKDGRKGAARSRNLAVRRSTAEVLVFLDDDTEIDPGYIEAFLTVLEADPEGTIGGLSGTPARFRHGVEIPSRPPVTASVLVERFFLISSSREGRVLASGSRCPLNTPGELTPVDFLQGGNMAVRRTLFDHTEFNEDLDRAGGGYALGEDVVFSYTAGRNYRLYSTNRARMKHYAAPGNRPDKRRMNHMKVIHQYHFMHDVMKGNLVNHLAFAWSMIGQVLIHTAVFVRRPGRERWQNLLGVLSGVGHVALHPTGRLDA
jgi:glucosyl-dolichyl phosphate glucuronosyltransferase